MSYSKNNMSENINVDNSIVKSLSLIKNRIESQLIEKERALPDGFQKDRFVQNSLVVLKSIDGIQNIDVNSVARTLLQAAFLGLDFLSKECYAIVYKNQINFQTDYKGEVKLAKKYSINPIKEIYAKVVREGDDFQESIMDGRQTIQFLPKPFNDAPLIGAFAVALFKDDSLMYEVMSKDEIEFVKDNYSRASNSKAWLKSRGEMYKKTVLRRLCKHISLDFKSSEVQQAWDISSGMEFDDKKDFQSIHTAKSSLDIDASKEVFNINKEDDNETN